MKNNYKKIAKTAAIKSGLFIKKSVGKIRSVHYKGVDNIVTDVDKKAEKIIIDIIRKNCPGHSILSEEAGSITESSPYRWIIDPLDGTTNFAHSFPFFCVSIALEFKGRVILGVVYDPIRKELFHAVYGRGAYLNNKRMRVSKVSKLDSSFLSTGFSYGRQKKCDNINNFRNFLELSMAIRRAGSAALDLCYVACGIFDGFWEQGLHPWDSAAGALILTEAGGRVTKFNGMPYSCHHNEILATNGLIHGAMLKVLATV